MLSLPCLTNKLNVPDPVFEFVTSHLTLSLEPDTNEPFEFSDPELFINTPSDSVSRTNASANTFEVPPANVPTKVPLPPAYACL